MVSPRRGTTEISFGETLLLWSYAVEKLCQSVEIWYATSEYLKQEMNSNF